MINGLARVLPHDGVYRKHRFKDRKAPDRVYPRRLDGETEGSLTALARGDAPAGLERWTPRLLADELVRLAVVDTVSNETVRRTLVKER